VHVFVYACDTRHRLGIGCGVKRPTLATHCGAPWPAHLPYACALLVRIDAQALTQSLTHSLLTNSYCVCACIRTDVVAQSDGRRDSRSQAGRARGRHPCFRRCLRPRGYKRTQTPLSLSVSLFLSHASMTLLTTIVFFCVSLSLVYAWSVSLVRPGRPYGPDGVRQAVQAAVAEAGATPWLVALHTWLPTAL
jgi:hypothetical protein